NDLTERLLTFLTLELVERLADKHQIAAKGPAPWLKSFVAGSDDHSGINPGRTWTTFLYDDQTSANTLIQLLRRREPRPDGAHGGPITLVHALLKLLYDGSKKRTTTFANAMSIDGSLHSLLELVFEMKTETWSDKVRRQRFMLRR